MPLLAGMGVFLLCVLVGSIILFTGPIMATGMKNTRENIALLVMLAGLPLGALTVWFCSRPTQWFFSVQGSDQPIFTAIGRRRMTALRPAYHLIGLDGRSLGMVRLRRLFGLLRLSQWTMMNDDGEMVLRAEEYPWWPRVIELVSFGHILAVNPSYRFIHPVHGEVAHLHPVDEHAVLQRTDKPRSGASSDDWSNAIVLAVFCQSNQ